MIEKKIETGPSPMKNRVDYYEALLDELKTTLHETHYFIMKIKSQLISQYGNVPGYYYSQMSHDLVSIIKVRRQES